MSAVPRPGVCSVTFRHLAADDVLALAAGAGLEAIEWGADVHVVPGGGPGATALARRCADAGIACPSYGSYWFAGRSPASDLEPVLASARALGATWVRVWTPFGAAEDERDLVADALAAAATRAEATGLRLGLEFHPGTLTETAASTVALLDAVAARGATVWSWWQPTGGDGSDRSMTDLEGVLDRLAHVHVFAWGAGGTDERLALAEHASRWRAALARVAAGAPALPGGRCAHLEFVAGDDPDRFRADAATLRAVLADVATTTPEAHGVR